MKKEEFKRLLKDHGQVTIGINPFDLGEIYATYQMDEHGDVYEVDEIDQTRGLLFNINDDAALQELENDLLCDVCSYSHNPFEHAVAYIKDHLEHWEIERGWAEIGKRMPLPSDTAEKIYCLLSDFSIDNDLPDGWWEDYDAEDFFMEIDNE